MQRKKKISVGSLTGLQKCLTGISGLDEVTGGGLPQGRPTLVCGGPGCGKTVLAMEFIVRGALQYDEPGVFMSFEEPEEDLIKNFASLGFDLKDMIRRKKVALDHVFIDRRSIMETGEYDLEALFLRLEAAINEVHAKRVALDTIEALFSGFSNHMILRAELRRLFHWLKDKGATAVITGESGEETLTRHGLEEYVADCVIVLDHRMKDQIGIRRLRIVKYRGSSHGLDEYPFLVEQHGISVLPITSLNLDHEASPERISTGIERLDTMLGGQGYYRGSTVLVSGSGGTGKSSIAAHFLDSACKRGESALLLAFEESENQIVRNMRSIGIDLRPWLKKGLMHIHASRPTAFGLEAHLLGIHQLVADLKPRVVVVDPVSNLTSVGNIQEVKSMLMRLIDFLKWNGITTVCTHLSSNGSTPGDGTEIGVSSLMDTWIVVSLPESDGERNRRLYILKSRGMEHSHQVREMLITNKGIQLADVYLGPGGAPVGAARAAYEAAAQVEAERRARDIQRLRESIDSKRNLLEAQLGAMRAQFEIEKQEIEKAIQEEKFGSTALKESRLHMGVIRRADNAPRPKRK